MDINVEVWWCDEEEMEKAKQLFHNAKGVIVRELQGRLQGTIPESALLLFEETNLPVRKNIEITLKSR